MLPSVLPSGYRDMYIFVPVSSPSMVEVFVVEKDREVVEIAPVAKPELLLPDGAVEKETRATDAIDGDVAAEGLIFKVVVLRASRFAARRQYWIAADDMVTMLTDDETISSN